MLNSEEIKKNIEDFMTDFLTFKTFLRNLVPRFPIFFGFNKTFRDFQVLKFPYLAWINITLFLKNCSSCLCWTKTVTEYHIILSLLFIQLRYHL